MLRKFDFMTAKSGNTKTWKHAKLSLKKVLAYLAEPTLLDLSFEDYHDMSHAEQAKVKLKNPAFIGGFFEGKRSIQTIESRGIIALDIDTKFNGSLPEYLEEHSPYSFYIYESLSSTKKLHKYRVLFFLDVEVPAGQYEPLARKIASDLRIIDYVDRTCYRKNQLMYAPVFLNGSTCTLNEFVDCGESLVNVEELVDSFTDIYNQKEWHAAKDEGIIGATAEMQLADPRLKDGFVGQFCTFVGGIESAIEMFGLPYVNEGGERWTYTRGESANGFVIYDDGQHAYSNHESDPAGQGGHALNAFDLVRIHLYGDKDTKDQYADPKRAPSYKALVDHVAGLPEFKEIQAEAIKAKAQDALQAQIEDASAFDEVLEEIDAEESKSSKKGKKSKRKPKPTKTITVRGVTMPYDNLTTDAEEMGLFMTSDPDTLERNKETGVPKSTKQNLANILSKSPMFKNRILFDEFARAIVYVGRKIWGGVPEWGDRDTTELQLFCEAYGMNYSKGEVDDVVLAVAQRRTVNSLKDFFTYELPEWDKVERLDTMFADCLGAEENDVNALIAQKTLLSGLERAINDGRSKVQTVTVLQGSQGIKKSTFWEKLCPKPEWFADSKINIGHKDGYSILAGSFIFELQEFASVKRADRDEVKSFISSSSDKYRPSFARYDVQFNRHNIFVGSVNDEEFLNDPTGNRRFKVVACEGGKDLHKIMTQDYVLQLWAEAMELRKQGVAHWYNDKQEAVTEEVANRHVQRNALEELAQLAAISRKPENWELLGGDGQLALLESIVAGTCDLEELTEPPAERFTVYDIAKMLNIPQHEQKRYVGQLGKAINALPNVQKTTWRITGTTLKTRGYKIIS